MHEVMIGILIIADSRSYLSVSLDHPLTMARVDFVAAVRAEFQPK